MKKLYALLFSMGVFLLCLPGCGPLPRPSAPSETAETQLPPGLSSAPELPADSSPGRPDNLSEPERDGAGYVTGAFRDPVADGAAVSIVTWIEGEEETDDGFHLSSPLGVALDYDPECFDVDSNGANDGVLQLTGLYNNGTADVFFTVEMSADPFEDEIAGQLPPGAQLAEDSSCTVGGQPAQCWQYETGDQWNSPCGAVYSTAYNGRNYRLTLRWYRAASEGYGARLAGMLETLYFLEAAEAG